LRSDVATSAVISNKMPDVDLANRHAAWRRCAAKTGLCVTVSRSWKAPLAFACEVVNEFFGYDTDFLFYSRSMTLIVAERARALIIGLRYGLPWYFAR
jgi:hypothetical protein